MLLGVVEDVREGLLIDASVLGGCGKGLGVVAVLLCYRRVRLA
jgi:hypothetical protein